MSEIALNTGESAIAQSVSRSRGRSGTVIIGVLACLVVCTAMVMTALQTTIRGRREARLAHQMVQVQWLCEAGMHRAIEKLRLDPQYSGETWHPNLGLRTYESAEVEIESTQDPEHSDQRKVTVTGRLDAVTDNFGPLQRTHNFQYTISTK